MSLISLSKARFHKGSEGAEGAEGTQVPPGAQGDASYWQLVEGYRGRHSKSCHTACKSMAVPKKDGVL